jgi:hypothetical protein
MSRPYASAVTPSVRLAVLLVGDMTTAEEIVQDAFDDGTTLDIPTVPTLPGVPLRAFAGALPPGS